MLRKMSAISTFHYRHDNDNENISAFAFRERSLHSPLSLLRSSHEKPSPSYPVLQVQL